MNIFIILCLLAFSYVIINFILDSTSPISEVEAILIDKNIETTYQEDGIVNNNYILTFEFNDTIKHYSVKYSMYKKCNIEDKGILTYQRNRFVDFKRSTK